MAGTPTAAAAAAASAVAASAVAASAVATLAVAASAVAASAVGLAVATYGEKGCWGFYPKKEFDFRHMGEIGSPHMGKRGAGDFTQKKIFLSCGGGSRVSGRIGV